MFDSNHVQNDFIYQTGGSRFLLCWKETGCDYYCGPTHMGDCKTDRAEEIERLVWNSTLRSGSRVGVFWDAREPRWALRVCAGGVRNFFRFWHKRSQNCDFMVLHSPSTLSTSKIIWQVGPAWGVRRTRFGWEKFSIVFAPYSIDEDDFPFIMYLCLNWCLMNSWFK
jgi:hypothetical protein